MIEDPVCSPEKAAGRRIRLIREALSFSRRELADKYKESHGGLSAGTLKGWEEGRFGGLTLNGAEKLQKIFKDEGVVDVTTEWLIQGVGHIPSILDKRLLADRLAGLSSLAINHELGFFNKLHKDAISTIVEDDGMAPCLQPGYHVAGIKLFGEDIRKAIGWPSCIVQLKRGQILVRMVEEGDALNRYNLICTNSSTIVENPVLENAEIYSAACIVWIRIPEPIG